MGTMRTWALGSALVGALIAAAALAAPPTAVKVVPNATLDTANVSRPQTRVETTGPIVSALTPAECTQHNGSVLLDSYGVCPLGMYCMRQDNKGVTHRVCIDRL